MRHSVYANNDQYGKNSKYSPIKRDTTPNRMSSGRNPLNLNINTNLPVNTNAPLSSRNRVKTYTSSPVYEGTHTGNYNNSPQDYRMTESNVEEPSYGHTATFYPTMNQSAYVGVTQPYSPSLRVVQQ